MASEHAKLDWSNPIGRLFHFRTHPQEIIENTVDIGHFTPVHQYANVKIKENIHCDGPHLTMKYLITRHRGLLGLLDSSKLEMLLDINASGVGFSRVQVTDLKLGMNIRLMVMPTPINRQEVEVRVITQVTRPMGGWGQYINRIIPQQVISAILNRMVLAAMTKDFIPDKRIWEHKIFQSKPKLAPGDGPIMLFRSWAQNFMPQASNNGAKDLRNEGS